MIHSVCCLAGKLEVVSNSQESHSLAVSISDDFVCSLIRSVFTAYPCFYTQSRGFERQQLHSRSFSQPGYWPVYYRTRRAFGLKVKMQEEGGCLVGQGSQFIIRVRE